jgi:shikimate dehydrogenase
MRELPEDTERYSLLINATPCGMFPQVNETPAGPSLLSRCEAVFDSIYNPGETLLLRLARRCGCRAVGGMGMLVHQAASAQQIWLGSHFEPAALDSLIAEMHALIAARFPLPEGRPVVLCGFMGCGKSSLGRAVAKTLGLAFADADSLIVSKAGMSIPALFAQKGEAAFRAIEREVAMELSEMRGVIIASGGGMLTDPRNMEALRGRALIGYIETAFPRCYKRIQHSTRPLVRSKTRAELEALYRERQVLYRQAADFTVRNDRYFQRSLEELARRIKYTARPAPSKQA